MSKIKNIWHSVKEIVMSFDKTAKESQQDFKEFFELVKEQSVNASKRTHYDRLNEWSKPIWDRIHFLLEKYGFKNGEREENQKNPNVVFWCFVYEMFSNIIYSPNLKTQTAHHHSSAYERNEAMIFELSEVFRINDDAELLYGKMFKKRLDPNNEFERLISKGWKIQRKGSLIAIKELLVNGCKIKTGYYTTSVRDFHDYVIFYK